MASEEHLFHSGGRSPLGRITLMASITQGRGVFPATPLRIYGSYAFVVITRGAGSYRDANGIHAAVQAGNAVFVHPALPHTYSPEAGSTWDEFYLVFSGPAFDAWHALGLFDPRRPVCTLSPLEAWLERLRGVAADTPGVPASAADAVQVCRLLTLLTEIVLGGGAPLSAPLPGEWLSQACRLLGSVPDQSRSLVDLIQPLGMPYETFRRRFSQEIGISPAQFRAARIMETACHLLQYTSLSGGQIAERLCFSDEYHFSRRFKQLTGETPTQFRRRLLR